MTTRRGTTRFTSRGCMAATLLAAGPALAQQVTTGLPSREQIAPVVPQGQAAPPKVTIDDRSARPSCDLAPSAEQIDLRTADFVAAGGQALPADIRTLLAPIRPQPGLQATDALCLLRDRAAERLREAGYIAAVSIPPQDIEGGTARFEVILAHFEDVRLTGKPGRYARRLAARIGEIKALRPINRHVLERMLLAIDDIPGLSITLTLRSAGTEMGAIIGDMAVDYDPIGATASLDNLASQAIGPVIATGRVEGYGLTGLYDRSYVGASTTIGSNEQKLIQAGHYLGDGRGFTVGGRFSYVWTRPSLLGLDIRSRSMIAGIDVSHQLLRRPDGDLALSAGLEIIDQKARLLFNNLDLLLSRDRLRVAYARLSGNAQFGRHALGGQVEFRQGLSILGASPQSDPDTSRRGGDTTATVLRATIEDVVSFGPSVSLAATVDGQWTNNPVLGFEQYVIGNYTIGRGYDPGAASGDRAVGVRLEPRFEFNPGGSFRPQIFAFVDYVQTWNVDAENGGGFTSFGGGLRLIAPSSFAIDAIYAHRPGKREVALGTSTASNRVLVSIAGRF